MDDGGANLSPNASYMIFPAYDALGQATRRPEWKRLADSGLALAERGRFGRHGLPPDWLKLGERLAPAPGWPARFGFDARPTRRVEVEVLAALLLPQVVRRAFVLRRSTLARLSDFSALLVRWLVALPCFCKLACMATDGR